MDGLADQRQTNDGWINRSTTTELRWSKDRPTDQRRTNGPMMGRWRIDGTDGLTTERRQIRRSDRRWADNGPTDRLQTVGLTDRRTGGWADWDWRTGTYRVGQTDWDWWTDWLTDWPKSTIRLDKILIFTALNRLKLKLRSSTKAGFQGRICIRNICGPILSA